MGTKFVVNVTTDGVSIVEVNKILNRVKESVVEMGGQIDDDLVITGITQDQANELTIEMMMMVEEIDSENASIGGGLEMIQ
jgi:hypothetical protein